MVEVEVSQPVCCLPYPSLAFFLEEARRILRKAEACPKYAWNHSREEQWPSVRRMFWTSHGTEKNLSLSLTFSQEGNLWLRDESPLAIFADKELKEGQEKKAEVLTRARLLL
jgi:hypothetical protein